MPQRTEVAPTVRSSPSKTAKPSPRGTKIGGRSAKRVLMTLLAALLFSSAVIATLVYIVNSQAYQSTDDAFIDGHIVPVSAKVAGRVQSVYIRDNQMVTGDQTVVELDPRDFAAATRQKMAAMQSSEAQAAAAQAAVQQAIAHVKTEQATVESDQATAAADAAQNEKAQSDLQRYQDLYKTRVVAPQDLDQYRATAKSAKATLDAANKKVLSDEALVNEARAEVDAYQGLVESMTAQIHEADANLATAKLNQSYADIVAPESGWVTQKSVEPGEYVQAGQTMFALVPQNVWVTANFKEDQIRRMRPGQEVEIAVDALHGKKFRGHVDSIQAGSGARFSLLPPENATGNYVKVVQRVPVKILFDEPINSESDLPLGPGESVVPTVKVSSVDYSPVAVGIATVVIAVGLLFILRRGLGIKGPPRPE
ncbi:MAG TPA: HlyD family secretion protein [Chthoniobacterales bacterium]|nr:HlyD family secretion protein [Chthoniobacterales bacterium]